MDGDFEGIPSPIGILPKHKDLQSLFSQVFEGRDYTEEEYIDQFSIHCHKYLEKYDRMELLFKDEPNMPVEFWSELQRIRNGVTALQDKIGKDIISPLEL